MFNYKFKYKIAKAKLELISHKDFLNVAAFDKWFCDDTKPRGCYAHKGIYLRGDKLSTNHIKTYWHSLTDLHYEVMDEVMDEFYIMASQFETSIRMQWLKIKHP